MLAERVHELYNYFSGYTGIKYQMCYFVNLTLTSLFSTNLGWFTCEIYIELENTGKHMLVVLLTCLWEIIKKIYYINFCSKTVCQKLKLVESSTISASHIVLLSHTLVLHTDFQKMNARNLHADSIRENGQILFRMNTS